MFSESPIKRRKSTRINVGNVPIGDGAPIAVQSMTNTDTMDVDATVAQIQAIQDAGADIVRVSVPTMDAAECFRSRAGHHWRYRTINHLRLRYCQRRMEAWHC